MSDNNTPNTGAPVPPKPVIPGVKPFTPGVAPAASDASADNTTRTVRLKPITAPPPVVAPPSVTAPIPGADPIPDGPRPPTPAQVQAAKSKTSRISLEQAISMDSQTPRSTQHVEPANVIAAPAPGGAPRTIRLKRPTEMPTLKVNAVPPPSPLPGAEGSVATLSPAPPADASDDAAVTQKRTLKVRKPGAPSIAIGGAAAAQEPDALPDGMEPIDPASFSSLAPMAKPEKGNAVFVTFAFLALAAGLALVVFSSMMLFEFMGDYAARYAFNIN